MKPGEGSTQGDKMPSTGARLSISKDILADAFKLRPADAIAFMKQKGYAISWNWTDTLKEAHARAFTVARVTQMDILQDIRTAVLASQRSGLTERDFVKLLKPRLQAKGWWGEKVDPQTGEIYQAGSPRRLKTIFRVNNQTAFMTGRYKQMKAVSDTFEYWEYIAVRDSRTRPEHAALHGKVFRQDDPIWDAIFPPNGWNCRCRVRGLTRRQMEREGLTLSTGEVVTKEVNINGVKMTVSGVKSGSTTLFPDPAWDYNPGKAAYQPDLSKYDPDIARQYVQGSITGPDYKRFFEAAGKVKGEFPVAVLPDEYMEKIGAVSRIVKMSDETLKKNITNHPELVLADYQRLQNIIENAQVIVQDSDVKLVFMQLDNKIYYAAIKATVSGKALFLTSLRLANEYTVKQSIALALKRGGKILKDEMFK